MILTPENFMLIVQNLPESERSELKNCWEAVYQKTIREEGLSFDEQLRYAIATAYCQAVYDSIAQQQLNRELKERIIRV